MAFFWFFIVLAITYNQGAARPTDSDLGYVTNNGWTSSSAESSAMDSEDGFMITIPTEINKGLVITINGTLDLNDKAFTVVLPSVSGQEPCQLKLDFNTNKMQISPAVTDFESTEYTLQETSSESSFALKLIARVFEDKYAFGMSFNTTEDGESSQLICYVKNFNDINRIVMKEGVMHLHSLLFEFDR